jgi:hypothetical protein
MKKDRQDGEVGEQVIADDPNEPYVTFFFPLPEPLSLPAKLAFRELVHVSAFGMGWLDHAQDREIGERRHRDLTNTWVTTSSVILHHVKVDFAAAFGMDAMVTAVRVGLSGVDEDYSPVSSGLEGDRTVAEIALPLFVTLTRLNVALPSTGRSESFDATVLAAEHVRELFDVALDRVRRLQSAYHVIEHEPLTLLTAELLPPIISYLVRTPEEISTKSPTDVHTFELIQGLNYLTRKPDISDERVTKVINAGQQISESPLSAYLELDREAAISLMRAGNKRNCVVMAATSAEVILNLALLLMQWEEGMTPEQSAKSWKDGLVRRVKVEYGNRIGGSWDTAGTGAIGAWDKHVANVRHRVVHAGYDPTAAEAERAIAVSRELVTFIGDRLSHGGNLNKYPRAATLLVGTEGLKRRGRLTRAVQDLQSTPSEANWSSTFGFWHRAYSRLMLDVGNPRRPSLDRARILAVCSEGPRVQWIAHDVETGLAAVVVVEETEGFTRTREGVDEVAAKHAASAAASNRISIAVAREGIGRIELLEDWVEEYHLVPLVGVMFDWSNFTAPVD